MVGERGGVNSAVVVPPLARNSVGALALMHVVPPLSSEATLPLPTNC